MDVAPLSPTEFASAVTAITAAFGDPTRRDIYLFVHEHDGSGEGVTAAEVAERFDLHPNVARHHLDKLAGGGHLTVRTGRIPGSPSAGRPSKRYHTVNDGVGLDLPVRHDGLLVSLLGRALAELPPRVAEALAEEVGADHGRELARAVVDTGRIKQSFRTALQTVADALNAHGFGARTDGTGDELRIVSDHCPFGDAAVEHPVICAIDRGLVRGMLETLHGTTTAITERSRATGSSVCVTRLDA